MVNIRLHALSKIMLPVDIAGALDWFVLVKHIIYNNNMIINMHKYTRIEK